MANEGFSKNPSKTERKNQQRGWGLIPLAEGLLLRLIEAKMCFFHQSAHPGEAVLEVDATQKSKKVNPTGKNPKNYCSPPTIKPHQYPHVSTSQNFYFFYLWFEKPKQ